MTGRRPPPRLSLQGFQRVRLEPGECRRVEFRLGHAELARVDADGRRFQAPGLVEVHVGGGQPGKAPGASARVRVAGALRVID